MKATVRRLHLRLGSLLLLREISLRNRGLDSLTFNVALMVIKKRISVLVKTCPTDPKALKGGFSHTHLHSPSEDTMPPVS